MKRRLFVKNVSLAIPATILIPSLLSSCKDDDLLNTDWDGSVIIIGAGAAGLYAGQLLSQYAPNASVQIVEASLLRGGRIRELIGFADFPIEIGAEEIHGEKTEWYEIVKSAANANIINPASADYYVLDTIAQSEADLDADADFITGTTFVEQATSYSGTDISVKQKADNDGIPQRVRSFINAQTGNEYGTDYSLLSIKGITEEDQLWTAGDNNYALANRSYTSVLEEKFSNAWNKVQLNTAITKIEYNANSITLTDQNNQQYSCDKLIITVPLSILKNNSITFIPQLPNEKLDAIQNIGMGAGMKIILKFNNRFWANNLGSLFGNGTVPEYWYPSLGKGNTPVLTAFVMGTKAEYLGSLGNNAIQTVLAELDSFFGNNAASTNFADGYIMNWTNEPYIKGAYSFPTVNGGISKREALARKINNNLFFAGEATHTEGHSATVHGAIETGYRAVKELIDSVK